jgi:hypothetical protein
MHSLELLVVVSNGTIVVSWYLTTNFRECTIYKSFKREGVDITSIMIYAARSACYSGGNGRFH